MAHSIQTRALLALGYSLVSINNRPGLFPDALNNPDDLGLITQYLTELDAIDTELSANVSDSMAVKVGDITVNYGVYVSQTLAKADRLLKQLSYTMSTPIAYNKYGGGSNPVSIRSAY